MVRLVRSKVTIGVYVMIRPRQGDFCYTDEEFQVMKLDIELSKKEGVDGLVFGILSPDGTVSAHTLSHAQTHRYAHAHRAHAHMHTHAHLHAHARTIQITLMVIKK